MSRLHRAVKEDLDRIKIDRLLAHITQLESDNATIVEDAAMVADENKRLRRIAEAAVRYLTHQDYDGLLVALRAEGYLKDQEFPLR